MTDDRRLKTDAYLKKIAIADTFRDKNGVRVFLGDWLRFADCSYGRLRFDANNEKFYIWSPGSEACDYFLDSHDAAKLISECTVAYNIPNSWKGGAK